MQSLKDRIKNWNIFYDWETVIRKNVDCCETIKSWLFLLKLQVKLKKGFGGIDDLNFVHKTQIEYM